MSARSTYEGAAATAHGTAEFAGITVSAPNTVALPGNLSGWSRQAARPALSGGQITQSQFVSVLQAINTWEQVQINNAKDVLRGTGDNAPA